MVWKGRDCDGCAECEVCLNCTENKLYCQNCDKEEIKKWLIKHKGYSPEILKYRHILCNLCDKHYVWEKLICEACDRVEYCPYKPP